MQRNWPDIRLIVKVCPIKLTIKPARVKNRMENPRFLCSIEIPIHIELYPACPADVDS